MHCIDNIVQLKWLPKKDLYGVACLYKKSLKLDTVGNDTAEPVIYWILPTEWDQVRIHNATYVTLPVRQSHPAGYILYAVTWGR